MPKIIHRTTLTIATLTILTVALYNATSIDIILTFAITLGITSYHFIMRLLVGLIFNQVMRNRADYTKSWYQVSNFENRIYKKLNVKKWKNRMPTYDSSLFDTKIHSLQEIVQAMCQAELVHEMIVVLSFVPIVAGVWFGAYPVFVITSALAAMLDLMFVMVQRYQLFLGLGRSKFRSSFHLKQKDIDYINEKGLDTIREHAREFIAKREAPAVIPNDGKQTPMKGHPVFVAQHATATCCRECIRKWHKIQPGRELSRIQREYLVDVIMTWIEKETTN